MWAKGSPHFKVLALNFAPGQPLSPSVDFYFNKVSQTIRDKLPRQEIAGWATLRTEARGPRIQGMPSYRASPKTAWATTE